MGGEKSRMKIVLTREVHTDDILHGTGVYRKYLYKEKLPNGSWRYYYKFPKDHPKAKKKKPIYTDNPSRPSGPSASELLKRRKKKKLAARKKVEEWFENKKSKG